MELLSGTEAHHSYISTSNFYSVLVLLLNSSQVSVIKALPTHIQLHVILQRCHDGNVSDVNARNEISENTHQDMAITVLESRPLLKHRTQ